MSFSRCFSWDNLNPRLILIEYLKLSIEIKRELLKLRVKTIQFFFFYFSAIVPEGKEAQATFKLTPYRVGVCRVSVTFRADMLSGVYGMSGVRVRE